MGKPAESGRKIRYDKSISRAAGKRHKLSNKQIRFLGGDCDSLVHNKGKEGEGEGESKAQEGK